MGKIIIDLEAPMSNVFTRKKLSKDNQQYFNLVKMENKMLPRVDHVFKQSDLAKLQQYYTENCEPQDCGVLDFKDITHTRRIDLIYKYAILNLSIAEISNITGVIYSTVRTIIRDYRVHECRVNRLLNFVTKRSLIRKKLNRGLKNITVCPELSSKNSSKKINK